MFQPILRSVVALTLVVFLVATSPLVYAQASYPSADPTEKPSAEAIAADVLLLRPAGFLATVLGSIVFVIALPISLPTRSVDYVAEKLVVAPAKYTFVRPLGVPEQGTEPDIAR
jgi:hypothetical protein